MLSFVTAAFACVLSIAEARPPAGQRTVDVRIKVLDQAGEPVPDFPFQIMTRKSVLLGEKTGPIGEGRQFRMNVLNNEDCILVGPVEDLFWRNRDLVGLTDQRLAALHARVATMSFRVGRRYPITPGQTTLDVVLQAEPGIRVSGRLVDSNGTPIDGGSLWPLGRSAPEMQREQGLNRFFGTPKGRDGWLLAMGKYSGPVWVIPVTAAQTAADLDLGDIVLPAEAPGEPVALQITGLDSCPDTERTYDLESVTLISVSTPTVVKMWTLFDGGQAAPRTATGPGPAHLPVGEYSVVPMSVWSDTGSTVLLAALQGRDLSSSNLARITVTAGGPNTFTIDGCAALNAARAVPEP